MAIEKERVLVSTGGDSVLAIERAQRAGRDGCDTTSTGRSSLAARARSAGTANSGVPKKTVRSIILRKDTRCTRSRRIVCRHRFRQSCGRAATRSVP